MSATNYDIHLNYVLNAANAEGGVNRLASKLNGLSSVISSTRNAVAGYFGGQAVGKALIGYNMELESSITSLATTMFGFGQSSSFDNAMKSAAKLTDEYREIAKKSLGESSDFISMHQDLQGTLLQQGFAYEKIKEVAVGATVASQLFGEEAGMTALDLKQMAMGTMTAKDRVGGLLAGMYGASKGLKNFGWQEWNEMAKNSPEKLKVALLEAVNNDALKKAADQMGNSFAGQWSTAIDTVKQVMGDAGKGMFGAISGELKNLNKWFEANKEKVAEFGKAVGQHLITAFRVVAGVFKFIADHSGVFFALLRAFAAVKIAQGIHSAAQSLMAATKSLKSGLMTLLASQKTAGHWTGGEKGMGDFVAGGRQKLGASIKSAGVGNAVQGIAMAGMVGWELGTALKDATGGTTAWADRMSGFFDTLGFGDKKMYDVTRSLENWDKALNDSTKAARDKLTGKGAVAESMASSNLQGAVDARKAEIAAITRYLDAKAKSDALGGSRDIVRNPKAWEAMQRLEDAKKAAGKIGLEGKDITADGLAKRMASIGGIENRAKFMQSDQALLMLKNVKEELPADVASWLEERNAGGQGIDNLISSQMNAIMAKNGDVSAMAIRDALFAMLPAELANKKDATNLNADKKAEPAAGKGTRVNVNINRIEVQNDDPDRYVFSMMESFRKAGKNPSSARSIGRRG